MGGKDCKESCFLRCIILKVDRSGCVNLNWFYSALVVPNVWVFHANSQLSHWMS